MSEKHENHAHPHGHAQADTNPPAPADAHAAHKKRFDAACQTVANGIATLKAAGCTAAEANALALQLWEKTKAG